MQLTGKYRLIVSGDTTQRFKAGGRNPDQIGYIMQRLLTGEGAAVLELSSWGITVEPDDGAVVAYLRHLAHTASSDQARGAYEYAAEQIERGEHDPG